MKKDQELFAALRQELPRNPLPPQVSECFETAYRKLGVQKEPVKKQKHRGWAVFASSVAACMALLLTVNLAFPAFAESLPLIGGIFASFNGRTGKERPPYVNETVASHAQPINQPANPVQGSPVDITLAEASCDGLVLSLSLSLKVNDPALNDSLYFSEHTKIGYDQLMLSADDIVLENVSGTLALFSKGEERGFYYATLTYWIPPELNERDSLSLHLEIPGLEAVSLQEPNETNQNGPFSPDGKVEVFSDLDGNWAFDFQVGINSGNCRTYEPGAEFADVTLQKVTIGDAAMVVELLTPAGTDSRSLSRPVDNLGSQIAYYSIQTVSHQDGTETHIYQCDAPSPGAVSLQFTILDWSTEEIVDSYTLDIAK